MSTRTRIMLWYPSGGVSYGARAVKEVIILANPKTGALGIRTALDKLKGITKAEKLLEEAKKLPYGYVLTLVQEPRRTRKNRSIYWQYRSKQQYGGPIPQ